ncbi:unnamed protein product [Closterium sp. NIES-64]|nr:unnamed protein product [Closterium sp. NIES-64]
MSSQDTDQGRRGLKAGAEAAEGEAVEGGEENRREGTGEESSEGESVKEDGRGIGEGEGGSAVGEGGVTKGMGAGGWRGVVVGRGREERMRVVVAPHVNPEHARMLEGLKELQVIDADVAPAGICTRREFATWLMAFSEKLSASPTDRVYPAMFIEGISEQAYADQPLYHGVSFTPHPSPMSIPHLFHPIVHSYPIPPLLCHPIVHSYPIPPLLCHPIVHSYPIPPLLCHPIVHSYPIPPLLCHPIVHSYPIPPLLCHPIVHSYPIPPLLCHPIVHSYPIPPLLCHPIVHSYPIPPLLCHPIVHSYPIPPLLCHPIVHSGILFSDSCYSFRTSRTGLAEAGILPSLLGRKDEAGGAAAGEGAGEGEALFRPDSPLTRQDLLTWRFALEYSHLPPPDLAALRHTCGLIDAARISPAAQRAVSFDLLHHRGGMEHQPEGEEEGWGQAGGKGLGEGQGRGQDFKSATNAAVIPLVFGNVRRFDPLKPVTHAQAAAALTFGRTYETVNEAAVRVEVAEARKEADVARQEAESAKWEAAQLAEEMERVRREEEEGVRREREERECVERERDSLREEVERFRAEAGRYSSSGDDEGGGKVSTASGGLEGEETEGASGVAGEGEQGFGSKREAGGGGGAGVEGSASDGTEEGSIQEPAILPPGWWAELIQQRAEEAKHGAAKNLVKIKERSADVASSLAASVADGSLQRSLSKRAEEAARKVRGLQGADLKEGARMVREQVGGEVARRIEGVREVGERMVSMGREEASRMVRVGKGVMDRGVREIREKAGYRWAAGRAAGKAGSRGSVGSATAAAGAGGGGVKKQ